SFSSRRRHTRFSRDWSSDVCSSDLAPDSPALPAERAAAMEQLSTVLSRARQLAVDATLTGGGVDLHEPAEVPTEPVQPRPVRTTAAGAALGLSLAVALRWWLNGRRQSSDPRTQGERV